MRGIYKNGKKLWGGMGTIDIDRGGRKLRVNTNGIFLGAYKENIRELPYGLEVVKQLKPVDYVRKNNDVKTREMGFIAQDVEALLIKIGYDDQGFLTKDDKGLMSLRYNDFIALLTKAIQEQQDIIETQNNEIKSHKNEINSINLKFAKIQEGQKAILTRLLQLETSYKTE